MEKQEKIEYCVFYITITGVFNSIPSKFNEKAALEICNILNKKYEGDVYHWIGKN